MADNKQPVSCLKEKCCPCRVWLQCHIYVDKKMQTQRLKRKKYDSMEWYKDNFRFDYNLADIFGNG